MRSTRWRCISAFKANHWGWLLFPRWCSSQDPAHQGRFYRLAQHPPEVSFWKHSIETFQKLYSPPSSHNRIGQPLSLLFSHGGFSVGGSELLSPWSCHGCPPKFTYAIPPIPNIKKIRSQALRKNHKIGKTILGLFFKKIIRILFMVFAL